LTEPVRELLDGRNVCVVSSLRADGSVHAVPVWVDTDGPNVLLNSVVGRTWEKNLTRDPRVTCTIVEAANPYQFVEIRGQVVTRSLDGADDHIHRLARKYLAVDTYPWVRPEDTRVLFAVSPLSVFHMQPGSPELASTEPAGDDR
jgi:PPOX class probable F420-dependent enzyme